MPAAVGPRGPPWFGGGGQAGHQDARQGCVSLDRGGAEQPRAGRAVVLPELVIPRHPDDRAAPAAGDGLGLLDVAHRGPADPVDNRDRPASQLGVPVRFQPLHRHRDGPGRVRAGRRDQEELVGDGQHSRHGGRARVGQRQVIAGGQQLEDAGGAAAAVLAGAMPSQCLAADHSQLRRGRLGPAALARAVRRRPGGHGRHRPGPLGQRAGPGVQVQHGHRLVPDPGQDLAGHQRGHRLAGADGAAEHHDPARAGHLQQGPGPVPLREVRLTRPVTARHDHNPVAPAVPAPVRGPAQRTLDHPQWPVAAPVPRHRHRRPGRRRLSRLLRGRRLGRQGPGWRGLGRRGLGRRGLSRRDGLRGGSHRHIVSPVAGHSGAGGRSSQSGRSQAGRCGLSGIRRLRSRQGLGRQRLSGLGPGRRRSRRQRPGRGSQPQRLRRREVRLPLLTGSRLP